VETVLVHSRSLRAVAYDSLTGELVIRFWSGTKYRYADVPAEVHAGLMDADSKGSYFSEHIRGKYDYSKVG
jgi:hypothetical protein